MKKTGVAPSNVYNLRTSTLDQQKPKTIQSQTKTETVAAASNQPNPSFRTRASSISTQPSRLIPETSAEIARNRSGSVSESFNQSKFRKTVLPQRPASANKAESQLAGTFDQSSTSAGQSPSFKSSDISLDVTSDTTSV